MIFTLFNPGLWKFFQKDKNGRVSFSVELGKGDFFGENVAIGYADKRNASAKAVCDVEVLLLSGAEFRELASRMPVLRHYIHVVMKKRGVSSEALEAAVKGQKL